MDNHLYRIILALLLVVVLVSIYFQFTTFGTGEYWFFVVVLLVVFVISRFLRKHQSGM